MLRLRECIKLQFTIVKQYNMKKVTNWFNYDHTEKVGERNKLPSKTVPDQSLSVREILDRYARGLPASGTRQEIWDGEEDLPDPRTLDLADIQEMREANQADIARMRADLEKQDKARKEKKKPVDEPKKPLKKDPEDPSSTNPS